MIRRRDCLIGGAAALAEYARLKSAEALTGPRRVLLGAGASKAPTIPTLPTAGLVARYIAGQGVTTPGGSVTAWADQVGGNNIVTATGTVTNPTVLGKPLIRFATSSSMTLPASLSFNNRSMSVFVVLRSQQAYNPQTSSIGISAIFSSGQAGSNASLYWNSTPLQYRDSAQQSTSLQIGFGITIIGEVLGASSATIIQAAESQTVTQGTQGTVTGGFLNEYDAGNPFEEQLDIFEVAIYTGAVSTPALAAIRAYYAYAYGCQPTLDTWMAFVGDSQSVGYNLTNPNDVQWPNQMVNLAGHQPKWLNFAVAGTTTEQMNTAASAAGGANSYVTSQAAFSKLIAIVDGGTNDAWANGDSASTIQTSISTLRSTLLTAGYSQVWHVPIRPRGTNGSAPQPAYQATRTAVNTWLTGASGFSQYVFSGLLSTTPWSAVDATNTTYYQGDTVHMTQAGWALQAATMYPPLKAVGILT